MQTGLLAHYLEINEISQRELAGRLGCSPGFINGLVQGRNTDIRISFLHKLHKETEIPLDRLVRDLLRCKETRVGASSGRRLERGQSL